MSQNSAVLWHRSVVRVELMDISLSRHDTMAAQRSWMAFLSGIEFPRRLPECLKEVFLAIECMDSVEAQRCVIASQLDHAQQVDSLSMCGEVGGISVDPVPQHSAALAARPSIVRTFIEVLGQSEALTVLCPEPVHVPHNQLPEAVGAESLGTSPLVPQDLRPSSVSSITQLTGFFVRQGNAAFENVRPLLKELVKSVLVVPSEISAALAVADARLAKTARNAESNFRELVAAVFEAIRSVRSDSSFLSSAETILLSKVIHIVARRKLKKVNVEHASGKELARIAALRDILQQVLRTPGVKLEDIESLEAPTGSGADYSGLLNELLNEFKVAATNGMRGIRSVPQMT